MGSFQGGTSGCYKGYVGMMEKKMETTMKGSTGFSVNAGPFRRGL